MLNTLLKLIMPVTALSLLVYTGSWYYLVLTMFWTIFNPIKPQLAKDTITQDFKDDFNSLKDRVNSIALAMGFKK